MKNDHDHDETKTGFGREITRRKFLKTMGSGAAIAAASDALTDRGTAEADVIKPEAILRVNLIINGLRRSLVVEPRWSLLYVLREKLGLSGTKTGCERGECGACTVLIDEVPRYACLTLAVEAQGTEIVTLEGLMHGEKLGAVQQAFVEHDAFQCGYCTPGQIMSAEGLLNENAAPTPDEIR
ncbi:MAG: (2Fe-2S)-binding protein, partial [Desulfobacterales bacterium]